MMLTEDALGIGEELGRRFGLPLWQVAMTATEANRYVIASAAPDRTPKSPVDERVLPR